jgi:hypothetical protein
MLAVGLMGIGHEPGSPDQGVVSRDEIPVAQGCTRQEGG